MVSQNIPHITTIKRRDFPVAHFVDVAGMSLSGAKPAVFPMNAGLSMDTV